MSHGAKAKDGSLNGFGFPADTNPADQPGGGTLDTGKGTKTSLTGTGGVKTEVTPGKLRPEKTWHGNWSVFCMTPGAGDCGGTACGSTITPETVGVAINPDQNYRATGRKYCGRYVAVAVQEGAGLHAKKGVFKVIDLGPNESTGRILDLSGGAAKQLGLHDTTGHCTMYLIPRGQEGLWAKNLGDVPLTSGTSDESSSTSSTGPLQEIANVLKAIFSTEGLLKIGKVVLGALAVAMGVLIVAKSLIGTPSPGQLVRKAVT